MAVPAVAKTTSVYTDVSKCGGTGARQDMVRYECKGPGGRTVELIRAEGSASIVVDGDTKSPAAELKIPIGNRSKAFGDKVEWRLRDGKPCAVITRVNTELGSRLIVTSLGKPAQIFAWDHTNKDAHKSSELACDSVGKPYTPPGEIAVEVRGGWSLSGQCGDGNKVIIGPKSFSVSYAGKTTSYDKVEVSHTFLHGGSSDEREYALLGYNEAGDTIEAIVVVNADGREDRIRVNPETPELLAAWSGIVAKPLQHCP